MEGDFITNLPVTFQLSTLTLSGSGSESKSQSQSESESESETELESDESFSSNSTPTTCELSVLVSSESDEAFLLHPPGNCTSNTSSKMDDIFISNCSETSISSPSSSPTSSIVSFAEFEKYSYKDFSKKESNTKLFWTPTIPIKTTTTTTTTNPTQPEIIKFKCSISGTVNDTFLRRGWIQQKDEDSDDWNIYICDIWQLRGLCFHNLKANQRVGHFLNCCEIGRKNLLIKNIKKFKYQVGRAFGKSDTHNFEFLPQSYIIPLEHDSFVEEFRHRCSSDEKYVWIIKPATGAKGKGIAIFSKLNEYEIWRKKYDNKELPFQKLSPSELELDVISKISTQFSHPHPHPQQLLQPQLQSQYDYDSDDMFDSYPYYNNNEQEEEEEEEETMVLNDIEISSSSNNSNNSGISNEITPKLPRIEVIEIESNTMERNTKMKVVRSNNPSGGDNVETMISSCDEYNFNDTYVVQRYILDPYLIGGKKFDLRFYVLVTSYLPLTAWVYREGFARFSTDQFSLSCTRDQYVHLTNVSLQRGGNDYDCERGTKMSLQTLRQYLLDMKGENAINKLMNKIDAIIIRTLQSVQYRLIQNRHSFELYGFDVLMDENMKPWLLEVNASPAFTPTSNDDYNMKCRLIDDVLNVLDIEHCLTGCEKRIGGFDLIWSNGPIYSKETIDDYYDDDEDRDENEIEVLYGPKLNSYIGCDNDDRYEQLHEMMSKGNDTNKIFKRQKHAINTQDNIDIHYLEKPIYSPFYEDHRFRMPH